MEGKVWTTPEELIEMVHWLSGASGKRWVKDRAGGEFTFGVSDEGRIGMLFDGRDYSCWQQFGPFTFLRDESEPESSPSELVRRARTKLREAEMSPIMAHAVAMDALFLVGPLADALEAAEARIAELEARSEVPK